MQPTRELTTVLYLDRVKSMRHSALDVPGFLLAWAVRRMAVERREWGVAMQAELDHIESRLQRWRFALGCIRVALFPPMNVTKSLVPTNPRAAALVGLLLALPIPLIEAIARFEIEPFQTFLKAWFAAENGVRQSTSSFVSLVVAFLLLPVASAIALAPAIRAIRAGGSMSASRINLSLGVVILGLFAAILGAVFIDQLPCFLGRPNCD